MRADLLARHRGEAVELLAAAIGAWRNGGFTRYDNKENSCTVRVFACLLDILEQRLDREPVQIIPVIEGTSPNADELAGRANFAKAKRPDLVLYLGGNHAVKMSIECKRLVGSANGAEYAANGIARFLTGAYRSDGGRAAMIGYVMTKEPKARISEINDAIRTHPLMGKNDELAPGAPIIAIDEVRISRHTKVAIDLMHLFVDLRTVYRQKSGLLKC